MGIFENKMKINQITKILRQHRRSLFKPKLCENWTYKPTSSTQLAAFLFVDSRWHDPHDAVQCCAHGLTFKFLFEFQSEFFVWALNPSTIEGPLLCSTYNIQQRTTNNRLYTDFVFFRLNSKLFRHKIALLMLSVETIKNYYQRLERQCL